MPSKVEAFKCDFCGKLLKREYAARNHEASCRNNPAKRHCVTCVHGYIGIIGYAPCGGNPLLGEPWEISDEVYGPCCGFHDKPISEKPYFIECEINDAVDVGIGVIPESNVPFSCWHYEYKGKAEWTPQEEYEAKGVKQDG